MLVEAFCPVDQVRMRPLCGRQMRQKRREVVTPDIAAERQVQGLACLLRRLLGSERGPFEMSFSRRQPGMVEVILGLT